MPSIGKVFLKPGSLAQKKLTAYEIQREKQIEKNATMLKSLGIKDLLKELSMHAIETPPNKKSQTNGNNDDDYVPPVGEDGSISCESDDSTEVAPAVGTKRKARLCDLQENTSAALPLAPSTLIPSTQDEQPSPPTIVSGTTTQAKKGRGKTSGKWLRLFKKRNGDVKIFVSLHQELNALCGDETRKVARLLGMHIRQHCPIRNTTHWQNVSPETQAVIIQAVLDHVDISDNYHNNTQAQKIVHEKCYILHKNWWCKMKRPYRKIKKAGDDIYSKPYDGVTPDDWRHMIDDIWKSDKHKKRAKAGKANRARLQYNHTSGSKSFVSAMTSKDVPIDGDGELDFPEFFKKTHQNKKEQWINTICEQKHAQMLGLRDESIQYSGEKLMPEDFSRQVLGVGKKKRYLRGFGVGPKSSQSSSTSVAVSQSHDEEVEKLRDELKEQNLERDREREEQQRKFEEQERKIEEQQRKFEEQQRQFEDFQNMVGLLLQDRQSGKNI